MENSDTKQELEVIALEGLMSYLEDRDFHLNHIPEGCEQLIEEQEEIGWNNFVKGRWSKEWCRLQEEHLETQQLRTEKNNGTTWVTSMISVLWTDVCELWEMRNQDRHGRNKTEQAEAKRAQAIREVEVLYQLASEVREEDSDLFHIPLEQLVEGTTAYMKAWIANWEKCILESVKRNAQARQTAEGTHNS